MTPIIVPKVGLTIEEVEVVEWHVVEGEQIVAGQPVVTVNADKTEIEIEAPVDGTLLTIDIHPGEVVAVGDPLGHLAATAGTLEEPLASRGAEAMQPEPSAPPDILRADATPSQVRPADGHTPAPPPVHWPSPSQVPTIERSAATHERVRCSPMARRLAAERRVDILGIKGSGAGGRILARDIPNPALQRPAPDGSGEKHLVLRAKVDVTEALGLLRSTDIRFEDLLVWAALAAIDDVPSLDTSNWSVALSRDLDGADAIFLPLCGVAPIDVVAAEVVQARSAPPTHPLPAALFVLDMSQSGLDSVDAPVPSSAAAVAAVGAIQRATFVRRGRLVERPRVSISLSVGTGRMSGSTAGEMLRLFAGRLASAGDLYAQKNII